MIDRRLVTSISALLLLAAVVTIALPARGDDPLLAQQRWSERSHGLSLLPPLASRLQDHSDADDAILRIAGEGNYFIKVYIKTSQPQTPKVMVAEYDNRPGVKENPEKAKDISYPRDDIKLAPTEKGPLTLKEVMNNTIDEVANIRPTARILLKDPKDDPQTLNDKPPTQVIYFKIPDSKRGNWILGQAIALLDGATVAVLQLEVDDANFARVRPIFEAVAKSIQTEDPAKLVAQREGMLKESGKWRQTITPKVLHEKVTPEQWVRIVDNGKDIGYMRIAQVVAKEMNLPGVRVDMQAHLAVGDQMMDSVANFFASDDGDSEVWSIRTTARTIKPVAGSDPNSPMNTKTFAETGVRSKSQIAVSRQGPSGQKEFKWDRPTEPLVIGKDGKPVSDQPAPKPLPYLSQVELQMLDNLLPHKTPLDVGFYAYNAGTGKISLRSERVVPQPDGTCIVYSRLAPEMPEQMTVFAADGKLIKRALPNGQLMLPTTQSELKARATLK